MTNKDLNDIAEQTGLAREQVLNALERYRWNMDKFWKAVEIWKSVKRWPLAQDLR